MKTIEREQLIGQLNWRYATKQFNATRKIPAEDLETLVTAATLSPSSLGLQLWKFAVVENAEIREKLKAASYGQSQITDASQILVFAAKKDITEEDIDAHIRNIAEVQGVPFESLGALREMAVGGTIHAKTPEERSQWAKRQVFLPLGVVLTSASLLGIDACPMEGFDPAAYDEILGLDKLGYSAVAVAAIGYRSPEDKYANAPKVRFPQSETVLRI